MIFHQRPGPGASAPKPWPISKPCCADEGRHPSARLVCGLHRHRRGHFYSESGRDGAGRFDSALTGNHGDALRVFSGVFSWGGESRNGPAAQQPPFAALRAVFGSDRVRPQTIVQLAVISRHGTICCRDPEGRCSDRQASRSFEFSGLGRVSDIATSSTAGCPRAFDGGGARELGFGRELARRKPGPPGWRTGKRPRRRPGPVRCD